MQIGKTKYMVIVDHLHKRSGIEAVDFGLDCGISEAQGASLTLTRRCGGVSSTAPVATSKSNTVRRRLNDRYRYRNDNLTVKIHSFENMPQPSVVSRVCHHSRYIVFYSFYLSLKENKGALPQKINYSAEKGQEGKGLGCDLMGILFGNRWTSGAFGGKYTVSVSVSIRPSIPYRGLSCTQCHGGLISGRRTRYNLDKSPIHHPADRQHSLQHQYIFTHADSVLNFVFLDCSRKPE